MAEIDGLLTLHTAEHSNREIADLLGINRETVGEHVARAKAQNQPNAPSGSHGYPPSGPASGLTFSFKPVAIATDIDDRGAMQEAVERGEGKHGVVGEDLAPIYMPISGRKCHVTRWTIVAGHGTMGRCHCRHEDANPRTVPQYVF
jgi:hypothetical protein